MTDEELDAVCGRHGIGVGADHLGWHYAVHTKALSNPGSLVMGTAPTREEAVCRALKARWGIRTTPPDSYLYCWQALADGEEAVCDTDPNSELAAVVALADRLRESGS